MNRIHSLDGLRGIFACMVLLYHAVNNTILTDNFLVRRSDMFVDYFFVLSGFVISYSYLKKINDRAGFLQFMKKRFLRLYPLLAYTVTVYFVFVSIAGSGDHTTNIKMLLDSLFLMNSTKLLGSTGGMNYPSWSISAEMITYATFGIVLAFVSNARNCVYVIIFASCFFFFLWRKFYDFKETYGFIRGIFSFIIGYTAYLFSSKSNAKFSTIHEVAVIAALLAGFWISYKHDSQLIRAVFPLFFGIAIPVFVQSSGLVNKLLSTSVAKFIGRISYSIYLNHAIVLIVTYNIFSGPSIT